MSMGEYFNVELSRNPFSRNINDKAVTLFHVHRDERFPLLCAGLLIDEIFFDFISLTHDHRGTLTKKGIMLINNLLVLI